MQAFYQTGDAQQLCGAEKMIAFLAADIAAFKKAQQPTWHAIRGTRENPEFSLSLPPQPQLIIRKSGILKIEWNPHILLVAMYRYSHF